jgi:hypothetical protein
MGRSREAGGAQTTCRKVARDRSWNRKEPL